MKPPLRNHRLSCPYLSPLILFMKSLILSSPLAVLAAGKECKMYNLISYCDILVRDYKFKYLSIKDLVDFELQRVTAFTAEIKSCLSKGKG